MTGYQAQARDTRVEVDRMVFEGLRRMTPAERLRIAMRVRAAMLRLSLAGLRSRYPDATEDELRRRAGALRLGRELTLRTFGPAAERWLP